MFNSQPNNKDNRINFASNKNIYLQKTVSSTTKKL